MAANSISRRKLICNTPALGAAVMTGTAIVAGPVEATERDWKDKLVAAAITYRSASGEARRLFRESKDAKFDVFIPGFNPEWRAYHAAESRRLLAEADLFEVIFEGDSE